MKIRIMGCKEREDNIKKMLSSLPEETEVIWDKDHNSCHTLQRVLDTDDSILIMEDDIELCKDFFKKAKAEIEKNPDSCVMFYCSVIEELEERRQKKSKKYWRPHIFTQAFYLPSWIGKDLKKFVKNDERCNKHRYSFWINAYLRDKGIDRHIVLPSLVQHIWKESVIPWISRFHQSKTYKYE